MALAQKHKDEKERMRKIRGEVAAANWSGLYPPQHHSPLLMAPFSAAAAAHGRSRRNSDTDLLAGAPESGQVRRRRRHSDLGFVTQEPSADREKKDDYFRGRVGTATDDR